ncbi:MAG: ethanolamine utilization protein EutN [Planctomycetes bacterium]|nr:ethanolamine utilization protein EutN [Planctomycetota bacterium]
MLMARVLGSIWATVRHEPLANARFVLLQPVDESKAPCGDPLAALDMAGSGLGELVIYTTAYEAAIPWKERHPELDLVCVDATVVAVLDRIDGAPAA